MKILFLVYEIEGFGGNFNRAFSFSRGLASLGCDVTVISGRKSVGFRRIIRADHNVRFIQLADLLPRKIRYAGFSLIDIFGRIRYLLPEKFDIIHTFSHRPSVSFPALIKKKFDQTVIVSDWADLWGHEGIAKTRSAIARSTLGIFDEYWEKKYHLQTSATTVISSYLAKHAENIGINPRRLHQLPVGANHDIIFPADRSAARKRHGLPVSSKILVYSSLNEYDSEYLTNAIIALLKKDQNLFFCIAGHNGKIFLHKLSKANLLDRIKFFGVVDHAMLIDIISCGDLMILPYHNILLNQARFPNRFGEYISAGKPIATHLTGDLGNIIVEEKIGIALKEGMGEFCDGILDLLSSPAMLEAMGERARHLAENKFSIFRLSEKLLNFYHNLINRTN
ncbi:MAG TPA: glycosyltransferase [Cyclobacteriaceae bacterium]|nr:glycosyltransferase [Cyclobacteriaceae bacterium]